MCFDSRSSLLAWSLSYTIAWYLFDRNKNYDRWIAGFIIIFSCIQLLEGGIWTMIENHKDHSIEINDLLTRLILIVLLMQPFLQTYLGYKYTNSKILGVMCFVFFAMIIWGFYRIYKSKPGDFNSTVGPKGHLQWNDKQSPDSFIGWVSILYMIGMFLPLFFMSYDKGIPLFLIGLATFIYSLWIAGPNEVGSYWCFVAVAYSLVALII
jgi:hypothetical protein